MSIFKRSVLLLTVFPIVPFAMLLCVKSYGPVFFIPIAAWCILTYAWARALRCPSCDDGVVLKDVSIGSIRAKSVPLWVPKSCDSCGESLD